MESTIKILAILFVINSNCKAQQMVQTTKDVYLLKINEQQFINKPLKNLLKEIKPEIKTADATNENNPYYFSFKFRTLEHRRKNIGSKEDRVSLYVYVKTTIDWKYEDRPKGQELRWAKEEIEKYGDLIVVRIKVIQPVEE